MNECYVCMYAQNLYGISVCIMYMYMYIYMYIRTKGNGGRKLMARVKTFHLININLVQDACVCVVQAVNGNQREVEKGIGYDV